MKSLGSERPVTGTNELGPVVFIDVKPLLDCIIRDPEYPFPQCQRPRLLSTDAGKPRCSLLE